MHDNQAVQTLESSYSANRSMVKADISSLSLIWSRGINQKNESRVLLNTLGIDGVITARYTCKAPYILLINYDPAITNHSKLDQIYRESMGSDAVEFILRQ